MATTTAFSSLSVPVTTDDTMEMSSPATRNLDDDIDIDFDDYHGGVHFTDDERIMEDADTLRPGTGTDDMMEDDVPPIVQAVAEEEVMVDDGTSHVQAFEQHDEELIDYGEDELHDAVVEDDTLLPSVNEEPADMTSFSLGSTHEEVPSIPEAALPEITPHEVATDASEIAQIQDQSANPEDPLFSNAETGNGAHFGSGGLLSSEAPVLEHDDSAPDSLEQPSPEEEQLSMSNKTTAGAHIDTPGTPTDTGLHPMLIRYGAMQMPLFKSKRQIDGLLKDDNLANLSIAELIKNCRQRIASKVGEAVSEDQELVLGFEGLGLMLVEDSRASFESSLNDVLEVYLQLHRNDGVQEIPALSLTLSLQLKFASSFNLLKQAATGGQGMSAFGFLQPTGGDEYDHEEYNGAGDVTEHYAEEYGEAAENEEVEGTKGYQEGNADENGEYEQDDYFQEYEDYHGEEEEEEIYHDDQGHTARGLEDLFQGEQHLTDTINNTLDSAAAIGQEEVTQSATATPATALGTTRDLDSSASSTTVQADGATDRAARPNASMEQQDDFETFFTDFDGEEEEIVDDANAKDGHENVASAELANEDFDTQPLGSEDFPNDLGEQEDHGELAEEDEDGDREDDEGESQYFTQADTYEEQQDDGEGYHHDYEPADGEDEFHTAQQDLFADNAYDHADGEDLHENEDDEEGIDDTVDTVVRHPVEDDEYAEGDETHEDFEDDLGFDDDAYEQDTGQQQGDAALQQTKSRSPIGSKRSFDQHADEDDLEFEEQLRETKKSRAS